MNLKNKRIIDNEIVFGIDTDAITGCCSLYKTNILKLSGLVMNIF